jgi:hypothetical protein
MTDEGLDDRISIPGRGKAFFFYFIASRLALGPTQAPIQRVQGMISSGLSGWVVKLTTYLHLVPRSKIVELYLHSRTLLHDIALN